jgi:hypothetical protein
MPIVRICARRWEPAYPVGTPGGKPQWTTLSAFALSLSTLAPSVPVRRRGNLFIVIGPQHRTGRQNAPVLFTHFTQRQSLHGDISSGSGGSKP